MQSRFGLGRRGSGGRILLATASCERMPAVRAPDAGAPLGNTNAGSPAFSWRVAMTKAFRFTASFCALIFVAYSAAAEEPIQLKYSRVVDLTLPIETDMAGIPGFKIYADNPSLVAIISAMTDAQKELLRAEGLS